MDISLNILLDKMEHWNKEIHIPLPSKKAFSRPSLLPTDNNKMNENYIYVCHLSDALKTAFIKPNMHYLCIRNRIKDDSELSEITNGMIILNENLEIEELFSFVLDVFTTITDWYLEMQNLVVKGKTIQDIITSTEPIIGNTINVSDYSFSMLARTMNITTDDPISVAFAEHGCHPESNVKIFNKHNRYEVWNTATSLIITENSDISKYIHVGKVFRFQNTYFAHVVMVCDHYAYSEGLLDLFKLLANIINVYAERDWDEKSATSHNYDNFFKCLLEGTIETKSEIEERAQDIGLSPTDKYSLMKFVISPGKEPSLRYMAWGLLEIFPTAKAVIYEQSIILLNRITNEENTPSFSEDVLRDFLTKHYARVGISNIFFEIHNIPIAYQQASIALKYSKALYGEKVFHDEKEESVISPSPILVHYQDRTLHSFLGENPKGEELWLFSKYGRALEKLYKYDKKHKTNSIQILYTYLLNNRNSKDTSEALFMHRNSVFYRVSKIEEILGIDLNDHYSRLGLEMSFIFLEVYGVPNSW